jgi:hypothetical protein
MTFAKILKPFCNIRRRLPCNCVRAAALMRGNLIWSEIMKRLICIVLAAASLSACVVLPVGHGHGYGHRHYSAPSVVVVPPAPGPGYRRGYRGW